MSVQTSKFLVEDFWKTHGLWQGSRPLLSVLGTIVPRIYDYHLCVFSVYLFICAIWYSLSPFTVLLGLLLCTTTSSTESIPPGPPSHGPPDSSLENAFVSSTSSTQAPCWSSGQPDVPYSVPYHHVLFEPLTNTRQRVWLNRKLESILRRNEGWHNHKRWLRTTQYMKDESLFRRWSQLLPLF